MVNGAMCPKSYLWRSYFPSLRTSSICFIANPVCNAGFSWKVSWSFVNADLAFSTFAASRGRRFEASAVKLKKVTTSDKPSLLDKFSMQQKVGKLKRKQRGLSDLLKGTFRRRYDGFYPQQQKKELCPKNQGSNREKDWAENTHRWGKDHCTAGLQFK